MNKQFNLSKTSILSAISLSIVLTACGGGGGGGNTNVSADNPPSEPVAIETVTDPIEVNPPSVQPEFTEVSLQEQNPQEITTVIASTASTSHEIIVPDGFSLNSERLFDFKIMRSDTDNQAAYLSICSDYQQDSEGTFIINYDSCLLRTSLENINYETVISVTNNTKSLVAALWFKNPDKEPLIQDWQL